MNGIRPAANITYYYYILSDNIILNIIVYISHIITIIIIFFYWSEWVPSTNVHLTTCGPPGNTLISQFASYLFLLLLHLINFFPEAVDSWPFKVTFLTLALNISAKGPAKGPND